MRKAFASALSVAVRELFSFILLIRREKNELEFT